MAPCARTWRASTTAASCNSLWQDDPSELYARVTVPTALMAAVDAVETRPTPVTDAADRIADAQVIWYVGAHHDLHAQQPERCADDLLELARRVDEVNQR